MRSFNYKLDKILSEMTILESIKTDFFDMYLLSSMPHRNDPEVSAILTDRVDRLIQYFVRVMYRAFLIRVHAVLPNGPNNRLYKSLINIDDISVMYEVITNIANNGDIYTKITGEYPTYGRHTGQAYAGKPLPYGTLSLRSGGWNNIVEIWKKFCNPPSDVNSKILLLDKFFGLAHNSGPLTDYLETPWLFDALYTKALAHPNELAQYASHDAREVSKSADIGAGLGTSLSSFIPVTDDDKLRLFNSKSERTGSNLRPQYSKPPRWLL
jgi:hypothetical protein